ncbi:MAG: hypothetical protein WCC22_00545 [Terriglobales bacterium]
MLSFLLAIAWMASAQTPLTTIDMPQGGRIVYGKVKGADTQGAAMTHVLRMMHQNCGEKPQIGKVFKMRGTDSVGLFFTVVNHPAGNVPVAGLIIAAGSGARQAEAALVSDRADRFGSTINPMLTKLFSVWHPGGAAAVSTSAPVAKNPAPATASTAVGHSAPAAVLRTVSASDGSATIGVPDGWMLDPHSASGTMLVTGPHGEQVYLGMSRMGIDPTHQGNRMIPRLPGTLIYPFRGDMTREFANMFQAWRRANGKPPAPLQVDEIKPMQGAPGAHCVIADGQVDLDGKGMQKFSDNMCASNPGNTGGYTVTLSHMLVSNALAEQEHATLNAILSSWKVNLGVVNQQAAVAIQQMNADTQAAIRRNQGIVANINQIGADATARMNATQRANDAQHSAWRQGQEDNSRNIQGFSNYLLDQTVIRDVQDPNTHVTVWNQAAEAWKKAYPDRIEEVPTSQYINGQDY